MGTDMSVRKAADAHEAARSRVMTQIASGNSLPNVLDSIVRDVESRVDWHCRIMLVDATDTRLVAGAAPSLPESFNAAIQDPQIGAHQGCCGTAAHTKARVITKDRPALAAARDPAEHDIGRDGQSHPAATGPDEPGNERVARVA
jgi:hypothetical protein